MESDRSAETKDAELERKPRDPEDRAVRDHEKEVREKMMDKTLADSFPTSDPPSTIPDPSEDSMDPAA